jgi:hypothetical protein
MSTDTAPPQPLLETFDLRGGVIESDLPQESVDAFAADFQGLRHFGEKLGGALDLGIPWMGALQEETYCVAFSSPERNLAGTLHGKGARVCQRALLFELLTLITTQES